VKEKAGSVSAKPPPPLGHDVFTRTGESVGDSGVFAANALGRAEPTRELVVNTDDCVLVLSVIAHLKRLI